MQSSLPLRNALASQAGGIERDDHTRERAGWTKPPSHKHTRSVPTPCPANTLRRACSLAAGEDKPGSSPAAEVHSAVLFAPHANNNPILYTDPSGHSSCVGAHADDGPDCAERQKEWSEEPKAKEHDEEAPWVAGGNQAQLNIMAGASVPAQGADGNPTQVFLLYYSLSAISDSSGNIQLYIISRDISYVSLGISGGGYVSGPLEAKRASGGYGIGADATWGPIWGQGFNTDKFAGRATSYSGSVGMFAGDAWVSEDHQYRGADLGVSIGTLTAGDVNTVTYKWGPKISLPPAAIPACRMLLGCGVPAK
jgi:hypothetical protein